MERLDKFISGNTQLSRKEVKIALKSNRILVNGQKAVSADMKIDAEKDEISLDGKIIHYSKYIYILMNKPDGVICSTEKGHTPTVIDILPDEIKAKRNLSPAGRLDKDTTGLILITDDGQYIHDVISPSKHTTKQYEVTLSRPFEDSYIEQFEKGMVLADGTVCKTAKLLKRDNFHCAVIITEGKYHQVKRMFAAVGNNVEKLHRKAIGGQCIDEKMAFGEYVVFLDKSNLKILNKFYSFF